MIKKRSYFIGLTLLVLVVSSGFITFKEEKDKKIQTIEVLNTFYGFDLDKNFTDAADAIMHLIYFNNINKINEKELPKTKKSRVNK